MQINRIFTFSASHFLTNYKGKCENLHGHNYKLIVTVKGEIGDNGLVIDFKDVKKIVKQKIIDKLDHVHLNDIIINPTAENICLWIWNKLKNDLALNKITIYENDNCFVEYYGQ